MRIAFIHPQYPSAEGTGATYDATQIVTGLVDAGHDVCVYCSEQPEEMSPQGNFELRELTGHSSHPHSSTRLNREIIARQDEFREFEILHSYLMKLIPAVVRVGRKTNVATVVSLNAYGGVCPKNDLRYLNREPCQSKSTSKCLHCLARTGFAGDEYGYLYQTASRLFSLRLIEKSENYISEIDRFHSLSTHVKDIYTGFGYDPGRIDVIPSIADTRFNVGHETAFEEPHRLLYVGSLKHSKGVDRLPKVISRVTAETDTTVSLTIVGDGELMTEMRQKIAESDLSDVVELAGRVSNTELPDVYANHDLFVYPGRWDEPFGRVFLEAIATGTPVVSTDVGSVAEIIGDAGVVTEQSVDALVEGVLSMLDPETLRRHSAAGRQRRERYLSAEIVPAFEELYADARG